MNFFLGWHKPIARVVVTVNRFIFCYFKYAWFWRFGEANFYTFRFCRVILTKNLIGSNAWVFFSWGSLVRHYSDRFIKYCTLRRETFRAIVIEETVVLVDISLPRYIWSSLLFLLPSIFSGRSWKLSYCVINCEFGVLVPKLIISLRLSK